MLHASSCIPTHINTYIHIYTYIQTYVLTGFFRLPIIHSALFSCHRNGQYIYIFQHIYMYVTYLLLYLHIQITIRLSLSLIRRVRRCSGLTRYIYIYIHIGLQLVEKGSYSFVYSSDSVSDSSFQVVQRPLTERLLHPAPRSAGSGLAFTRYCFTLRLLRTNQSSFHVPRPPALPTLVQYYCTIIGQYTSSLSDSRLYAIHQTILAITISCKGQAAGRSPRALTRL